MHFIPNFDVPSQFAQNTLITERINKIFNHIQI
jgi:hypothetical protein